VLRARIHPDEMEGVELVGREVELGRLRQALAPGRMIGVSGPPGVGKTALLRAALQGRAGVLWVDLDGVRTAPELWSALGRALGVALEQPEGARGRLAWALRERQVVALDGAELLEQAAWTAIDELRAARPELAWLVGAVVGLRGADAELQLAPLPLEEATRLLVARAQARALERHVDLDDPAWRTLAERLDGLPLALELAAGKLALMSPRELLERLEIAVVRGAERRGSVEGALRFAWSLLEPPLQQALARLSLARGFDLVLAEALLGPGALTLLEQLRQRSALTARGGRMVVLEGLRQIALVQVDDEARAAFVAFWASHGRTLRQRYVTGPQQQAAAALRDEQANLRAALELASEPGLAVEIAQALLLSLRIHGPLWWLEELPDLEPQARSVPPEDGADLLAHWGGTLLLLGRTRRARRLLELALVLSEPVGPVSEARSLAWAELGWLELLESDVPAGRRALEAALACAPDGPSAALALGRLSTALRLAHDHEGAARALQDALGHLDEAKAGRQRATLRIHLGVLRAEQGRRVEAEDVLRQAEEGLAGVDPGAQASAALNRGLVELAFGDAALASQRLEAALELYERHGGEAARAIAAMSAALGRWAAGDRPGARQLLLEAAGPREGDPALRAWRAALAADTGESGSLQVELEAARADGAEGELLDVLGAFAAGAEPPPPQPVESLFVRAARRLLQQRQQPPGPAISCEKSGRWFEVQGPRAELARRGALRRILGALIEARLARPGAGLSVAQVFEAGWPGERARADAAATRVYTAVRELRALGLGELLRKEAEGYLLDPTVPLRIHQEVSGPAEGGTR
jgi:tetratricopeptide (TPR) repeat protein